MLNRTGGISMTDQPAVHPPAEAFYAAGEDESDSAHDVRLLERSHSEISVFGPKAVLTARLPMSDTGANTADPHLCDAYTGPIAAIAGETPVICSAGVATPCGLDLLGAAGVPVSREIRTYRTTEEFRRLVGDVIANGERLLCQHVHDEDEVPAEACMVAPDLLRYLNNKAN